MNSYGNIIGTCFVLGLGWAYAGNTLLVQLGGSSTYCHPLSSPKTLFDDPANDENRKPWNWEMVSGIHKIRGDCPDCHDRSKHLRWIQKWAKACPMLLFSDASAMMGWSMVVFCRNTWSPNVATQCWRDILAMVFVLSPSQMVGKGKVVENGTPNQGEYRFWWDQNHGEGQNPLRRGQRRLYHPNKPKKTVK